MNKKLSRVLSLILVLCMIPATVITAFARGKGVYNSGRDNQSIENAIGQNIPESIKVDGVLDDTGWPEAGFAQVDSANGYWNTQNPDSKYTGVTYKYQIRADYQQFYVGASVTMPEGVTCATFTVYLKDSKAEADGYTEKLVFDIDLNAQNKVSYDVSKFENVVLSNENTESETVFYPEEYSQFDYTPKETESQTVKFEFRNRIADTFSENSKIEDVTYFVSVDFKDEDEVFSLIHPKVGLDNTVKTPAYDYWPYKNDGTAGGKPVNTLYSNTADNLPYAVDVDGDFDEAVWSELTNYYIHGEEAYNYKSEAANDYISLDGDSVYGTGVKRNVSHYLIKNSSTNYGYYEYDSNDIDGNRAHIRFKYELRVDGEYLYGAVVAYVPPINSYTETISNQTYTVTTSPDLWVMFFDDDRNDIENTGEQNTSEKSDNIYLNNADGACLPESIIQIRSLYSNYQPNDPEYSKTFATYANCWVNRENSNGLPAGLGWGKGLVDVADPTQFQGARSAESSGNLWNFEFKVALDAVPTINGDIVYSICVGDRYGIPGSSQDRSLAFTAPFSGSTASDYYAAYPQYSYSGNQNNKITEKQITAAKEKKLSVTEHSRFDDAQLDQTLWAALASADNFVDGREKKTTTTYGDYNNFNQKRFAYKLSGDHEYIYGAAILSGNWSANEALKLWVRPVDGFYAYSAAKSQKLNIITDYSVSGATLHGSNNGTSTTLNDNSYHYNGSYNGGNYYTGSAEDYTAADRPTFSSRFMCYNTSGTMTMQMAFSSTNKIGAIKAYFSGGDSSSYAQSGVNIPQTITNIQYYDGANWISTTGTVGLKQVYKDPTNGQSVYWNSSTNSYAYQSAGSGYLHCYEYTVALAEAVNAQKIKFDVVAGTNGFVWCSEVDVYSAVDTSEYYTMIMPLDKAAYPYIWYRTSGGVSHALPGFANEVSGSNIYNRNKNYFDSVMVPIDYNNDGTVDATAFEFRVAWEALGFDLALDAADTTKLFNYYVTVDSSNVGLAHPRNNSGIYPDSEWGNDTGKAFTYGDMLKDIVVDGKLDEKYWIGDETAPVVMQEVNSTNGVYKVEPKYGNSLDYKYKLYAGEGYLYGAAVIDVDAVFSEKAYLKNNNGHTRFELWIDNNIDENYWTYDDDATTYKETAIIDGVQESLENYYYTFYLTGDSSARVQSNTGGYVCGGSTPNWFFDQENGGAEVEINEKNFSWGMTTINGKTYIEFMIDLDNFHCDRSKGFNYYVSAAHIFDNETEDTSDDELLTLFYPPIETQSYDLWITHYNHSQTPDRLWGVIYDSSTAYKNLFLKNEWWERAIFAPVGNGVYELKLIRHSAHKTTDHTITEGELPEWGTGWFAYALHLDGGSDFRAEVLELANYMQTWKVGDRFVFNGINMGKLNSTLGTQIKSGTTSQLLPHSFVISESGKSRENLTITDSDYRCAYYVTSADDKLGIDDSVYKASLPTVSTWDAVNAGSIDLLGHFAPEVVTVDGNINEPAWGNAEWIEVIDSVNGTYQDSLTTDKNNSYRYKIRTDADYLYLAAELDKPYGAEYSPSFRIWLKGSDEANTYTHFYRISYAEDGVSLELTLPEASYEWEGEKRYEGANDLITVDAENRKINYNNFLVYGVNTSKDLTVPVGNLVGLEEVADYSKSLFYGRTEEVQENITSGEYYPTIRTRKFCFGKESAAMGPATVEGKTWVEFKVSLDEFGGRDGFEYFVQATYYYNGVSNILYYPVIYNETASEYSYYENSMPYWKWFGTTAEKVTAEDMASGAVKLRNNCVPVVTLGAKISENYIASDGTEKGRAIRMGALYTEDYLRNWRSEDAYTLKEGDENLNEMYTAPINDYWDVADVGIVALPTQLLGNQPLTLETPNALALSADNIVDWINNAPDGWSNFADYENFVFYATIYGVPQNVKVSFRGYVDFYASANTDSFYDENVLIRSYDMIDSVVGDSDWIKENSKTQE